MAFSPLLSAGLLWVVYVFEDVCSQLSENRGTALCPTEEPPSSPMDTRRTTRGSGSDLVFFPESTPCSPPEASNRQLRFVGPGVVSVTPPSSIHWVPVVALFCSTSSFVHLLIPGVDSFGASSGSVYAPLVPLLNSTPSRSAGHEVHAMRDHIHNKYTWVGVFCLPLEGRRDLPHVQTVLLVLCRSLQTKEGPKPLGVTILI
ncbi:hypothetical protein GEV33_012618 [Tenebrio molitor]|uniref:Secreted protein n=1 Tax=Tenebrio molitor TaxID=7067 RepID=A0A8J6LEW2_TENMO|nr:hypothetical protein GEV33_012618 [Tenebrio molitor]